MTLNQGNRIGRRREEALNEQDAVKPVELQISFREVGALRNGLLCRRGEKSGAKNRRLKVRWAGSRQVLIAIIYRFLKERCGGTRRGGEYDCGVVSRKILRRGADEDRKA